MSDRELMQQALDALEGYARNCRCEGGGAPCDAAEALRARLAQPEPEPVAWWHDKGDVVDLNVSGHGTPLYFAPPKKEWVGLTDEEFKWIVCKNHNPHTQSAKRIRRTIKEIEDTLKEKNT